MHAKKTPSGIALWRNVFQHGERGSEEDSHLKKDGGVRHTFIKGIKNAGLVPLGVSSLKIKSTAVALIQCGTF